LRNFKRKEEKMRIIKFRGKDIETGEWVYGDLHVLCDRPHIHTEQTAYPYAGKRSFVALETIGQFTGLTDKNGKEIYEGDIVQWGDSEHKIKQVVEFRNGAFGYVYDTIGSFVPYAANTNFDFAALGTDKRFEIVNNIHDNPEMIEKGWQQ
jgi:uncharacterized phage protein (TIGR01671 family)